MQEVGILLRVLDIAADIGLCMAGSSVYREHHNE